MNDKSPRDTRLDTAFVWFDPERGYIFRDTEEAPESPWVGKVETVKMTEDLDPIETAIDWLKLIVKNQGILSLHDVAHVRDTVIPEALAEYESMQRQLEESAF